jgi:Zn-dependent protease with chaperone function
MMRALIVVALIGAWALPARAQIIRSVFIEFATAEEGREILTRRDDFVQRLSPFDRAARLKSDQVVAEETYLRFVAANVLEWTSADRAAINPALDVLIRPEALDLAWAWPATIHLVRTTGEEEGGADYTRGTAIVVPTATIARAERESLEHVLAHELFHILTRHNPALAEKLYAAIGFSPCGEIAFPPALRERKITNPDAPRNDHCIRLDVAGTPSWAVPILFSREAVYDVARGGAFFDYLEFRFLLLDGTAPASLRYDPGQPRLVELPRVAGFFEQVGRNTDYIIHPEEILAENFALLLRGEARAPSPEILAKMRTILGAAGGGAK